MRSKKPFVSIVIPLFNEESNIRWHHQVIQKYFDQNTLKYELLYVDDGSTDNSLPIIKELCRSDERVQYLSLSRNFGKEAATTAGLQNAQGEVVILMDADGQHPIDTVSEFLTHWHAGSDVVIGVRKGNSNEGFVKRYGSKLHNSLLNRMTDGDTVPDATDFRLIDRKVVDEFNKLTERSRITRGLIDWLGFKRSYVDFVAPARHGGEASYTFNKLLRLAIYSFTSQTTKPLRASGFLGFVVMLVSFIVGIILLVEKYIFHDPLHLAVSGTGMLAIFLSFLVGLVLISQGLLAIYIESIHNETQNRPLYIISEKSK